MSSRVFTAAIAAFAVVAMLAVTTDVSAETVYLSEGFEDGSLGNFTSTGSPGWSASTTRSYSGSYSAYAPDVDYVSDLRLTTGTGISIPSDVCQATLSFYHWHEFDWYPSNYDPYDGGVIEISTDGGTTWNDAGGLITTGGYNGQILNAESNPLGGRNAWVLTSNGWQNVTLDLSSLAGETILIRLREGTGSTISAAGWYVDDVELSWTLIPTISVTVSPDNIWPPDHTMTEITATVTASSGNGEAVELVSVTSNEADNGDDDGNTINDIQNAGTGSADYAFDVRKERSGVGSGRVYTATYRVTNSDGCTAEATAIITVPLSRGASKGAPGVDGSLLSILNASAPNPFVSNTTINYTVGVAGPVRLTVFNAEGRAIATLVNERLDEGNYSATFNADGLTSGSYHCVLETSDANLFQTMILAD